MAKIKLRFTLALVALLSVVMCASLIIKNLSIQEVYEDLTFMRISLEARQYISQVEYDIKYGRQLDNFYDMQTTLKNVQTCSSYMEGAYIVATDAKLFYQSGLNPQQLNLSIPREAEYSAGKLYTMTEDAGHYYLTELINNGGGIVVGYLIMCIDKNAVNNTLASYDKQNMVQTLMIALELLGIALFIIRRIRPDTQKPIALKLLLVLFITVTLAAALDSGLVLTSFYSVVNDAAHQAADKMAQSLQSQVDTIIAKGVSADRIYDLNGWLARNISELKIVTSLTLDRNNKITAAVSQGYINSFFNRFLWRISMLLSACVCSGSAAYWLTAVYYRRKDAGKILKLEKENSIDA
ncbi:hypothetical protein REC12_24420 [Desulfosporosinus sp. PR]|uniref:hypothetical protein n=1 Tax=Candidatus Desulfosporosinus nitrosoreducens TaxID=3401928 RepID=UPI0027FBCB70|nr:hypothetical protein [Desulfosporosinus sp. PR]MDQ7096742.1 hypothetical protein [Desulfosporosinus sp. PR]